MERGRRTPQPDFLDAADALLGAGGLLTVTKDDIAKAKAKARVRHPVWFRDYARLEREAVEIHDHSNHDLPGLFQTDRILTHWPPALVTAVIEESTLRRPIGGRVVHKKSQEAAP